MNKVIEFLKENPVQYLATVGRDGKAKCRPFMKFLFPAHLMHGFACTEKRYLKTTWLQKKCA